MRLAHSIKLSPRSFQVKPTHVLNAAGVTGRPNVDWCEDHKIETIRANILGCLNLADVTNERGIHMTYYGTGCIFHYDAEFPEGSGKGFKESDTPNFTGSWYSHCKAIVEGLLKQFPNVLTLRVRMPIVESLVYPRNFITKIIKYDKVHHEESGGGVGGWVRVPQAACDGAPLTTLNRLERTITKEVVYSSVCII